MQSNNNHALLIDDKNSTTAVTVLRGGGVRKRKLQLEAASHPQNSPCRSTRAAVRRHPSLTRQSMWRPTLAAAAVPPFKRHRFQSSKNVDAFARSSQMWGGCQMAGKQRWGEGRVCASECVCVHNSILRRRRSERVMRRLNRHRCNNIDVINAARFHTTPHRGKGQTRQMWDTQALLTSAPDAQHRVVARETLKCVTMSRVGGVTEWIDSTLRGGAGNDDSERTRENSTKTMMFWASKPQCLKFSSNESSKTQLKTCDTSAKADATNINNIPAH